MKKKITFKETFNNFIIKRRKLFNWTGWFLLLNLIIVLILSFRYIKFIWSIEGLLTYIYLWLALIGHFSSMVIILYFLLFIPLIIIYPKRWFIFSTGIFIALISILMLLVDFEVYSQYRFHLNSVVFELLINTGDNIFDFFWVTWLIEIVAIIVIFIIQISMSIYIWEKVLVEKKRHLGLYLFLLSLFPILSSNLIHTWADVTYYRPIISMTQHISLFHPLKAKNFLEESGMMKLSKDPSRKFNVNQKIKGIINYPQNKLKFQPFKNKLNLLYIILDCWQFDMMTEEIKPNIYKFIKEKSTLNFKNHISGGIRYTNWYFHTFL